MDTERSFVFPFLDLPIELRLQVYKWVHLQHPLQISNSDFQWCDGKAYVCKRAVERGSNDSAPTKLLPPYRPYAKIPTALLQVKQQIYIEARVVALQENEFMFKSVYSAGLATSRMLRQPWQNDALRYARMQIPAWDFADNSASKWQALCLLWAEGMRGLRLQIQSGSITFYLSPQDVQAGQSGDGGGLGDNKDRTGHGMAKESVPMQFMLAGLRLLKALQQLEIELNLVEWDAADKIAWCRTLEETLNENRGEGSRPVEVVCVERV